MRIQYLLNGIDITDLVYSPPSLSKKLNKGSNSSSSFTSSLQLSVVNDEDVFSAENSNSLIYDYREDYSKIVVEIKEDTVTIWKGVLDNITRMDEGTVSLSCVESIINILSVEGFVYYSGDGYVGDLAYAGSSASPAKHQLAVLRRFLNDSAIDVNSFKVLDTYWSSNSVVCTCNISIDNNKTPLAFLQDLLFNAGYFYIDNNRLSVRLYKDFLGDYGVNITKDTLISYTIEKEKNEAPYYSYRIVYNNSGTPTEISGSIGTSGNSTDTSSTVLTDSSKTWSTNQWKDKFVIIGASGSQEILKISGNNTTMLYFTGGTKSGVQPYIIVENNKIYEADYSDVTGEICITSGAGTIGVNILKGSNQSKLKLSLELLDYVNIDLSDILTITLEDEGIIFQPFEVIDLKKDLYSNKVTLSCIDKIMYPIVSAYQVTELDKPIGLTGYRVESDGSVYLSWTAVTGALFYKVLYGTSRATYSFQTSNYTNVHITDNLEKWLGYYFWVIPVNGLGLEGPMSDPLYLDKVVQSSGYIDGSLGYLYEDFQDWGYLEDYFYLITYKAISYSDIGYCLKSPLVILDRSQVGLTSEMSQIYADSQASQLWGSKYRRLGYVDGAGTSSYLPEFLNDGGVYKLKNPLSKKLVLTINGVKTVIASGGTIPDSENWFLKDYYGNYCTYWYQTGCMLDVGNSNQNEWFKVFKINQVTGIWDSGTGPLTVDSEDEATIGTITCSTKTWIVDQWENYYVGLVTSTSPLTITWYKITGNTGTQLIFDYTEDAVASQKFIINNEPYSGFHGILLDDVWTSIYREGTNLSNTDSNTTSDWSGDTWLTDNSKAWTSGQWAGYYLSIDGGTFLQITGNSATVLWFSDNTNTGAGKPYVIYERYYHDNGRFYWQAMASFLELLIAHIENNSYALFGSWNRAEQGIAVINCWPDRWNAYPYYVSAINKRYRHFIMFEALQSTWNMANQITRQFSILDWYETLERWNQMKITGGVGYARLASLGYTAHQQMLISHIAGSLILSRYSDIIEDITAASNIVLDQLYYDMMMAGNYLSGLTIGIPVSGYETSFAQSIYDRYGVILREFEGAYILYNPSRQIKNISMSFTEDVVNYHTGEEFLSGITYNLLFQARSASVFYKNSTVGDDAYNFLNGYNPYTYVDFNACWIVFTATGASTIGHNSVWITNGYTNNKRFITEGTITVPDGEPEELFHAGDGSSTSVTGHSASIQAITGVGIGSSVELSSLTVLHVVRVAIEGSSWVVEDSNTVCDWAGDTWLTDNSKAWTENQWVGKYVRINGGDPILITGNSATVLWFSGNTNTGTPAYQIGHTGSGTVVLTPGTDFLIEQGSWDLTASGKGKWKTSIYFLTDRTGSDINVYFFEQGIEDGWPKTIASGEQVEHGLCYRKSSGFALKTGSVNQSTCTTTLVEGTDYYIFPECVRWKWDYRISPFSEFTSEQTFSPEINLNVVNAVGGNKSVRAIHWGIIDPDNTLLVSMNSNTDNSLNGSKADYDSCTVRRPRVLIYGFSKTVRNSSLYPLAPADRTANAFLFENQIKKFEGIYYDDVTITGDWDGVIEVGSSLGAYGSIRGLISDSNTDFTTWEDIADYFDVILINDTFVEYTVGPTVLDSGTGTVPSSNNTLVDSSKSWTTNQWTGYIVNIYGTWFRVLSNTATVLTLHTTTTTGTGVSYEIRAKSISGSMQWASWLQEEDYNLLKNFKKRANQSGRSSLIFDRRAGAPAFVWYGGILPIVNSLLNRGSSSATFSSDLTDVFGIYAYGGVNMPDLSSAFVDVYLKNLSDNYVKFPSTFTTDFRIGKIPSEINHYSFDTSKPEDHPPYNAWENGGSWITYIPKSKEGRDYFSEDNRLFLKSKLYLFYRDLTALTPGVDNFYKYEEMGLNNIIYRREPLLIYHCYDFFNVVPAPSGTPIEMNGQSTIQYIAYPSPIVADTGKFRGCLLVKPSTDLETFLKYKTIFLKESQDETYKESFTLTADSWKGYEGHYIADVDKRYFTYSTEWDYPDFGWAYHYEFDYGFNIHYYGFWYSGGVGSGVESYPAPIDWGNNIVFDTYNADAGRVYPISKTSSGDKGCIPYLRNHVSDNPPKIWEGKITSIALNGDGTINVFTDIHLSEISLGTALKSGTIRDCRESIESSTRWYITSSINVSSYRTGSYYVYIYKSTGCEVYRIRTETTYEDGSSLGSYTFAISHSAGTPGEFIGLSIEVRDTSQIYKIMLARTDSENNVVFNGRMISKNDSGGYVKLFLSRAVAQVSSGGYIAIYSADEDSEEVSEGTVTVQTSNRDVLGGRLAGIDSIIGADIASTIRAVGSINVNMPWSVLEDTASGDKPASLLHYEWAYASLIKEFGYEFNTGLITCQLFYAHGATTYPPVFIWPGISENDFHQLVGSMIGTKLQFTNLHVYAGDVLYLYYNSFNDMLRIKTGDVENPINGHYKFGTLRTDNGSLIRAIVSNYISA